MKHPLIKLTREAQQLRLTAQEKAVMRAALMERVRGGKAAPRTVRSPYFFTMPQVAMPFAALLVMFFAGGGTLFASSGALPGDPLYSVKTMVSEPIRGVLAFSDQDKIEYHTQIAEARLEEAEVLASQNRLEGAASAQLQTNIDVHLAQRDALVSLVRSKHGDDSEQTLTDDLDSSLAAHSEVLAAIATESASSTTRENSNTIALAVRNASSRSRGSAPQMALMMAKTAPAPESEPAQDTSMQPAVMTMSMTAPTPTEAQESSERKASAEQSGREGRGKSISASSQSRQEKSALTLGKRATSSLEELKSAITDLGPDVSDAARAILDARVAGVVGLVAAGQAQLEQKDFPGASDTFRQALSEATTLKTFIDANKRFDNGILGRLLGSEEGGKEHEDSHGRGSEKGDN